MPDSLNPLGIRRALGRLTWGAPERFGPEGWAFPGLAEPGSVIVSQFEWKGVEWIHASIAHRDRMPDYDELVTLHRAVFGEGRYAFQVFAPTEKHVSIHDYALHLWGRADGKSPLPDFAVLGTI